MAMQNPTDNAPSNRVNIIQTVRSPLGFFSLVVLAVETILGITANLSQGADRTSLIVGMLILIFLLVVIVTVFAVKWPGALIGESTGPGDKIAADLGSAVRTFDRLSDEIGATIRKQPQPQGRHPPRYLVTRIGEYTVAYSQLESIYPDDHFKQLPADVKHRIETYRKSIYDLEKAWESIKREHAISQLDPQVQEKQLQLIKLMRNDLVGLLDTLQEAGFYLVDHYRDVYDLLLRLPPAESTSSEGRL